MSETLANALELLEIVYKTGGDLEQAKNYIYSRIRLDMKENDRFLFMFRFYVEMRNL